MSAPGPATDELNVRLQELVRQSTVKVKHEVEPGVWGTREDFDKKKFAELVMEDCFKVAVVAIHQHLNERQLKAKLKDRFGID